MKFSAFLPVLMGLLGSTILHAQQNSVFDRWDKDKNGKLSKEELPPQIQRNFDRADQDGDGFISREEDAAMRGKNRPSEPGRSPEGVERTLDVDYAGNDNPKQKLDLYLPSERKSEDPLPVICWIHGGGWKNGDKAGGGAKVMNFVRSGKYAGISIGYRLSGEAIWPAQIHDCKAAIRWIHANAETYGLDPDRIAVWGSSAGGHLVAMLGVTSGVDELEGEIGPHGSASSKVACVVDYYGPTELLTMNEHGSAMDHDAANSPESALIGGPIQENKEKTQAASPVSYTTKDDAPFLIVHGDEDPAVPYQQSVVLEKALEEVGVPTILVTVSGGGHGKGFPPKAQTLVEQFLENQFYGGSHKIEDQTIDAVAPRQ